MKYLAFLISVVLVWVFGFYTGTNNKVEKTAQLVCGLTTGVPEYQYIGSTLYCRTKGGDLQRPTKARFHQVKTDSGIGYIASPLKNCKK